MARLLMANFLNTDGLSALWAKIKSKFYTKAEVDALIPEDEVMWVTITTDGDAWYSDKTITEIYNHVHNGGIACAKALNNSYDNTVFICNYATSDSCSFAYFTNWYDSSNSLVSITGSYINIYLDNNQTIIDVGRTAYVNSANTNPLMDGTATYGSSLNYARADHVHPSDTSRAAVADVLTKTNTTSYTPTANYHPATKKYVDDVVAAAADVSPYLSGLADTNISNTQGGQALIFNDRYGKWVNMDIPNESIRSLEDTTISDPPTDGQVLQYDSTSSKWVNATLPTGVTETRVNELIAAALAQYGDGDTATYGYNDASEVNY